MIRIIRQYHKTLSVVSPNLAAKSAFSLFTKVRLKKLRHREKPFYDHAKEIKIQLKDEVIHSYEFGNPEHDIVVLLHGWDSNSGSMYRFVEPLLAKNKYVLSFNMPAHAFHKSSKTNIFRAKETFKKFMHTLPENRKISIISHSFGSGVVGYGLSELDIKIDTLAYLTTPDNINDIFLDFKNMIGLNEKAFHILSKKASAVIQEDLEEFTISNKLKKAHFNHLHLFHDTNDKVLPYKNSVQISNAIENSTLHTLNKMGHYKMLWNEELVNQVLDVVD